MQAMPLYAANHLSPRSADVPGTVPELLARQPHRRLAVLLTGYRQPCLPGLQRSLTAVHDAGVRPWQLELALPVLTEALTTAEQT